jgi:uncharacterized protein YihD (DUF1040 family)
MKIETIEKANELLEKIKRAESDLHLIEKNQRIQCTSGFHGHFLNLNYILEGKVKSLIVSELKKEIQSLNQELEKL